MPRGPGQDRRATLQFVASIIAAHDVERLVAAGQARFHVSHIGSPQIEACGDATQAILGQGACEAGSKTCAQPMTRRVPNAVLTRF